MWSSVSVKFFLVGWVAFVAGLDCPDEFESILGDCYHFGIGNGTSTFKTNWREAREYCRNIEPGSDMVVVPDCSTYRRILNFIHINGDSYELPEGTSYWIGATDEGQEGAWFWVDSTHMDLGPPYWGAWDGFQEPAGGPDQNCGTFFGDDSYRFHDSNCDKLGFPLCQIRNDNSKKRRSPARSLECPEDFQNVRDTGCFHFNLHDLNSWDEGRDYCRLIGGDLASFNNCSIFKEVIHYIHLNGDMTEIDDDQFYWIGATDSGEEGVWIWVDYEPVALGPPLWGAEGPLMQPDGSYDENCAAMKKAMGYYIFDEPCNATHFSLCQAEAL